MKKTMRMVKAVVADMLVAVSSIACTFLIIRMLYSSLETDKESSLDILSLSKHLMSENYTRAIAEGNTGAYFANNMFNTVTTVCIVVVISFMTGYCLSRFKFRSRTFVYYILSPGMLVPIYALLIPIFTEFKTLGLLNKKYTLVLPYIAFALSVGVLLVESSVASVPIGVEGAACIDGDSFLRAMFAIVMPVYKPVLSTYAVLAFLNIWSEFPLALMLIRSNALETVPIGLTNFVGSYTVNYPLVLAALVISTLPMVIMYLLLYSQTMKSMMMGAVKG